MRSVPLTAELPDIREALLTWQNPVSRRRVVVGKVVCHPSGTFSFSYLPGAALSEARDAGFEGYPSFPEFDRDYTHGVLESFGSRLPSPTRRDFVKYLEYWLIDPAAEPSPFQLLAHTGAALPRDEFRFVPVLPTTGAVTFVTEIAGARYHLEAMSPKGSDGGDVELGQALELKREPENPKDPNAVAIYRCSDGARLGYVMVGLASQIAAWRVKPGGQIARINGTSERPVILALFSVDFRAIPDG